MPTGMITKGGEQKNTSRNDMSSSKARSNTAARVTRSNMSRGSSKMSSPWRTIVKLQPFPP